jgi:hypothetical protein
MFGGTVFKRRGLEEVQEAKRVMIGGYMPADLAERFGAAARLRDGSVTKALHRLISGEVGEAPVVKLAGAGLGAEVKIRLRGMERYALGRAASASGMTPAAWVRCLTLVHLTKKPEWNPEDRASLRAISRELSKIGANINQIAHALNAAGQAGRCPPGQGEAAREAVELVRYEMRRLGGVVTGNFDYWGLPDDERPTAKRGALARLKIEEDRAASERKAKLKVRPRKFATGKGNGRD